MNFGKQNTFYFSFLKKFKNKCTMSLSKTINETKCFVFVLFFKIQNAKCNLMHLSKS